MTKHELARKGIQKPLEAAKSALKIKPQQEKLVTVRLCDECGTMITWERAIRCPVCGSWEFTNGRATEMVYRKITLNKNGKATVCPHCDNEESTPGDYCMICGNEIVNRCADMADTSGDQSAAKGCSTILPGNARFCYACGNESTFYQKGWLRDWRSENTRKAIENINVAVDFDDLKSTRTSV